MKHIYTLLIMMLALAGNVHAQGWPKDYKGVMLQGFYWDSYQDTQWSHLESQADELSKYFSLIWVPQSGNCNTLKNQMGYAPIWWFKHDSAFGSEQQLRKMIKTFKEKGTGIIEDVVINHRNGDTDWCNFPPETWNGQTFTWSLADICKGDDQGETEQHGYALTGNSDTGDDFKALSAKGPLIGYGNDRYYLRAVKLYGDGALGSRGAALMEPYTDDHAHSGLLFMSDAAMQTAVKTALKAGYQVNVHAIGDKTNHQVLDAMEVAYKDVGGRDLRNRIEHAQVVSLPDIPRFKKLDLIASMQPTHATSDMNMAEDRIGKERIKGAYAWQTFLKQGTVIAGGSDFPVESANPFYGLHAAVTRTDHEGRPIHGWHPEEAMTLPQAFRAFTLDAAYAEHQEKTLGSLETGKWADFIVVDRDLFKVAPADIWKIQVLETWVAGERVYAKGEQSAQR